MIKLKEALRSLTPPILWQSASAMKRRYASASRPEGFEGPFNSWAEAVAHSDGWDSPEITEKSLRAALAAKNGAIVCEQDSVPQSTGIYSVTMLAFIVLATSRCQGTLNIIDFGGGLGSGYFQNRKILAAFGAPIRWNVVERPIFAALGAEHLQDEHLFFYPSLNDALVQSRSEALIFSGSLQYIEHPFALIDEVARSAVKVVAVDRMLTWGKNADGFFVQRLDPDRYYKATLARRCFSKRAFVAQLIGRGFGLVDDFTSNPYANFNHSGMLFARI